MVVPTKKYQRRSADRVRHMQRIRGLQEEADRKRYERMEQERIVMAANKKPSNSALPTATPAAAAVPAEDPKSARGKKEKRGLFGTRRGKGGK